MALTSGLSQAALKTIRTMQLWKYAGVKRQIAHFLFVPVTAISLEELFNRIETRQGRILSLSIPRHKFDTRLCLYTSLQSVSSCISQ